MVKKISFPHLISLFFTVSFGLSALAAPVNSVKKDPSLREQAEIEIQAQGPPSSSKTSNPNTTGSLSADQAELTLKLADPYQALQTRESRWTAGLNVQSFEPHDTDNNSAGATPLVAISFGYLSARNETRLHWGSEIELGWASQSVSALGANDTSIDARINSTQIEARSFFRGNVSASPRLFWKSGLGLGRLNQTQTSDDPLGRLDETRTYASFLAGADFQISPSWFVQAQLRFPTVASPQLGLGVQTVW